MPLPAPLLRASLALLVLAAAAAALPLGGARAASPPDEVSAHLAELASPAESERLAAVERLVELLPGARERVIEALQTGPPPVRVHLVDVLAEDGEEASVRALLETLREADDLLAARIDRAIALRPRASDHVRVLWAQEPALRATEDAGAQARLDALARLLERAEVERLFLSRKSRSGGTGVYRGQFDLLRPYREAALGLCADILFDREPAMPGIHALGTFAFLRPSGVPPDIEEMRGMAAHAVAELARPEDRSLLAELNVLLGRLWLAVDAEQYGDPVAFSLALERYGDLLVGLHAVWPDAFDAQLSSLLEKLSLRWSRDLTPARRAAVLLRVGRYEEAIDLYETLLSQRSVFPGSVELSKALTYYNLACAYAQWSERSEGRLQAHRHTRALLYLELAAEEQWSDVGWMDEDKDLDPIRDTDAFRRVRARILSDVTPPELRDAAPAPSAGSRR